VAVVGERVVVVAGEGGAGEAIFGDENEKVECRRGK
jgi:hypothetical protein